MAWPDSKNALPARREGEWHAVFSRKLGRPDRTLLHELRDVRNRWAHQNSFSGDDTYRALDSAQRLLQGVAASEEAGEIDRERQELLRVRFSEQARRETRKLAVAPVEGQPAGGLHPWREIVTPHPDVASGRYQQAEFAADLDRVTRNEGGDEYRNPRDFFAHLPHRGAAPVADQRPATARRRGRRPGDQVADQLRRRQDPREALTRLGNTFARIESVWRPATAEEGFEIVRRRLFQPIASPGLFALCDASVRAFATLYREQPQEFPASCREGDYERRMQAAYPIHPELFDRLYNDWTTLDRFQRTRGVLRLMAAVIHTLWERNDASLLILPATVPIDDPSVGEELTRYLDDPWKPVLEKDVDGPHSLPLQLDKDNSNFGRYSATRPSRGPSSSAPPPSPTRRTRGWRTGRSSAAASSRASRRPPSATPSAASATTRITSTSTTSATGSAPSRASPASPRTAPPISTATPSTTRSWGA